MDPPNWTAVWDINPGLVGNKTCVAYDIQDLKMTIESLGTAGEAQSGGSWNWPMKSGGIPKDSWDWLATSMPKNQSYARSDQPRFEGSRSIQVQFVVEFGEIQPNMAVVFPDFDVATDPGFRQWPASRCGALSSWITDLQEAACPLLDTKAMVSCKWFSLTVTQMNLRSSLLWVHLQFLLVIFWFLLL